MAVPSKFTPVQRSPVPLPPQKKKGSFPVISILLLAIYLTYLGVAIVAPLFVSSLSDSLDDILSPLYRVVAAAVLFAVFAMAILYMTFVGSSNEALPPPAPRPRPPAPSGALGPSRFKPVGVPSAPVKSPLVQAKKEMKPPASKSFGKPKDKPTIITYPLEVEGGIFGDTYIQLSEMKVIKLRSVVVEPDQLA